MPSPVLAGGPVVVNEIHCNPDIKTEPAEFIELANAGREPVDVSGWKISSPVRYAFPRGTVLAPEGYLVVARNPKFLESKFGARAAGQFEGLLPCQAGRIVLEDGSGRVVDQVEYRIGFPWPTVGDPPGSSLERIHPSLDGSQGGNWRSSQKPKPESPAAPHGPTPGKRNSVYAAGALPVFSEARHVPAEPRSGQAVKVTARVLDSAAPPAVTLLYQVVDPGKYIELQDEAYRTSWVSLAMNDEGREGDEKRGDHVYTAELPASLQVHRRLVRYRIRAAGAGGSAVTAPYDDDPQPNFAYFVYDGVPAWRGALHPPSKDARRARVVEFPPAVMRSVPAYHLIAKKTSVEESTWRERYTGQEYKWGGTLVVGGKVYDHIRYRARGGTWRYAMGKNMWKLAFNRGHELEARDNWGRPYGIPWSKLDLGACIQQGNFGHRGEQGMFESVGFRLFNLAGVEAPKTHWVEFRIIDEPGEAPDQYRGDFWGLYLAVEPMGGRFLEEHGLPDGNLYKMEGGTGEIAVQGREGVTDKSDLNAFMADYQDQKPSDEWWRKNLDLPRYYSYRSIVECIHHYDIDEAAGKNYFYFLRPETRRWSVLPWDIDLTWSDGMYGGGESPFKRRVLSRAAFRLEYGNRLREIRDLLYNSDQAHQLIEEYAAVIHDPSGGPSIVDADRAHWDFSPVMVDPGRSLQFKAGQGLFYRASPTRDFAGMVKLMKDYVNSRGAWVDQGLARDPSIPETPVVTATGPPGFPAGRLNFRASPYQGKADFASLEWRVGEVTDPKGKDFRPRAPRKYEIQALWVSSPLTAPDAEITVPASAVEAGHTYRARARVKDTAGRASHWSAPVEFTVGP